MFAAFSKKVVFPQCRCKVKCMKMHVNTVVKALFLMYVRYVVTGNRYWTGM